jgi:pimeloyl-ACP methyl ester carboxylesterase
MTYASDRPEAAHIAAGNGETVLLLHGSAGSSALWRRTLQDLSPLYRTVAPDLIGYGAAGRWPPGADFELDAEVRALSPLLPCCSTYHLVGYSYGGAIALVLALGDPAAVRTLTLIEPVFFAALRYANETAAYDCLCRVRDDFTARLSRGERETAMAQFIDFWTGAGAWAALPPPVRAEMLTLAEKIALDWRASFNADPGPESLVALGPRTLLVRGDCSPEPMCRLVDALHGLMPGSSRIIIDNANHLLPLTHGRAITGAILGQLHADAERRLT